MHSKGNKVFLDVGLPLKNYIQVDGIDYSLSKLPSGKAEFSNVFKAVPISDDTEDDIVIKFCKQEESRKLFKRFNREIDAIQKANEANCKHIIDILYVGREKISGFWFKYYSMECADEDLCSFLDSNELGIGQKLLICKEISTSIKELHSLDIYHRDIKPDNFFMFGNKFKIADLGLMSRRDEDKSIDGFREGIGPKGFMTPEATNYKYALLNNALCDVARVIDDKSDIFQLGKLFWYILQGDVPTGQVERDDFKIDNDRVFSECLLPMLQYDKSRRPDINTLIENMTPVFKDYAVI